MTLMNDTKTQTVNEDEVRTAALIRPEAEDRAIVDALGRLLADSSRLSLKTLNFHWNVEGPQFSALHQLFEDQYHELNAAIDEIAERMRGLGAHAPASFSEFMELSTVSDSIDRPTAREMCLQLAADHQVVSAAAAAVVREATERGDEGTADLAVGRVRASDKAAWFLASHVR